MTTTRYIITDGTIRFFATLTTEQHISENGKLTSRNTHMDLVENPDDMDMADWFGSATVVSVDAFCELLERK